MARSSSGTSRSSRTATACRSLRSATWLLRSSMPRARNGRRTVSSTVRRCSSARATRSSAAPVSPSGSVYPPGADGGRGHARPRGSGRRPVDHGNARRIHRYRQADRHRLAFDARRCRPASGDRDQGQGRQDPEARARRRSCRNGGTVSVIGVYGGFIDKFPMGSRHESLSDHPDGAVPRAALYAASARTNPKRGNRSQLCHHTPYAARRRAGGIRDL